MAARGTPNAEVPGSSPGCCRPHSCVWHSGTVWLADVVGGVCVRDSPWSWVRPPSGAYIHVLHL